MQPIGFRLLGMKNTPYCNFYWLVVALIAAVIVRLTG